jgi:hypothetical protein
LAVGSVLDLKKHGDLSIVGQYKNHTVTNSRVKNILRKTDLKEKESPVEVHTYGETTSYTLYKGRNMWTWGDGSVFGDF